MEPETEQKRVYHYPLSGEEVQQLLPDMQLIAARYTKCKSTRDDYVQAACLWLLTRQKVTTSPPLNQIRAAIKSHRKAERKERCKQFAERTDGTVIEPICKENGDPLTQAELERFEGLNLSKQDVKVARLYWLRDLTQNQIRDKVGIGLEAVVATLRRVREAVREKWL